MTAPLVSDIVIQAYLLINFLISQLPERERIKDLDHAAGGLTPEILDSAFFLPDTALTAIYTTRQAYRPFHRSDDVF